MFETLDIERSGQVATVWMNRPAVFNAFNEQLIADLQGWCHRAEASGIKQLQQFSMRLRSAHA